MFSIIGGGTISLASGSGWNLSGGDQILAYQAATAEPATIPNFISAINADDGNGAPVSLDPITFWNDPSTGPLGTAKSGLPSGLANGVNCISLFVSVFTEQDNAKYTGTLTGTSTVIRAAINDRTNWTFNNSTAFDISPGSYSPSVTCVAPCNNPLLFSVSASPTTICIGEDALISIQGSLNDATHWSIYTGSCGGTLLGTTVAGSFNVTPTFPSTTYYVRGEGGCVTPGTCLNTTVTVNSISTGTDIQTACDAYTWIDGNTYTSDNNIATHTLTNVAGCDSVVTLDLTVNYSSSSTDVQTACDSYTWIDGNTYTSDNNIATHILTNVSGCDSVVTLDLTINSPNTGVDVQVACESYTWIDGVTYTNSNNSATHTLTNVAGCDSVVTLNLTIEVNNINVQTVLSGTTISAINTAASSYQWIDCFDNSVIVGENNLSFAFTTNGNYAVIINEGACSDTSDCVLIEDLGISQTKIK